MTALMVRDAGPACSRLSSEALALLEHAGAMAIGTSFVEENGQERLFTHDPASGEIICSVPQASEADVDRAVTAATQALEGAWKRMPPSGREACLNRLADLVVKHADALAELESLDTGKPVSQVRVVDIALVADVLRYYAGWATKIHGAALKPDVPDMLVYTQKEPIGVVAAIVPWNFPLCQACFKLAPALAAGCTAVLKPAEQTPLSGLLLGYLAQEAGIPPGVINVVTGNGADVGQCLVDHPGVSKITFTGSESVGRLIAARAGQRLKRVSLELGGKNPNIIFADADVDVAAKAAAMAIFFYTGQVCAAGSRILVERSVFDRVAACIVKEAQALRMGHGLDPHTTLGPLISAEQLAQVDGFVRRAEGEGVCVLCGGRRPEGEYASGFFYEPTVLTDVADESEVACDEIFGPVAVIQPFDDIEELKKRANATEFGLSAGIWTKDITKAHAVAAALQAGTVWINTYGQFGANVPWGGYKNSGYGRDNGEEALEAYLQTKAVWVAYG